MSDEEKNAADAAVGTAAVSEPSEQPSFDEHTTEPNAPQQNHRPAAAAASGKWQMPKPKFQQTSGYLPQGYLKDVEAAAEATKAQPGSEDTTQEQPAFASSAAAAPAAPPPVIEPQPDLADQLVPEEQEVVASTEPTEAKKGPSVVTIVLGLAGILIFVVIFLAAVWYFLLRSPASNNF